MAAVGAISLEWWGRRLTGELSYKGVGGLETEAAHRDDFDGCFALTGRRDRQRY